MNLQTLIFSDPHPLLGFDLQGQDYTPIDLNLSNKDLPSDGNINSLEIYITDYLQRENAKVGYGGYLEKRNIYLQSNMFHEGGMKRTIHLGVDLWTEAGRHVFCPLEGQLLSFQYNPGHLDYGFTLILQHEIDGCTFYSLYGHLASNEYLSKNIGENLSKGSFMAEIGDSKENGGWPPHLHFQLILDLQGNNGDYPGVCSVEELAFYKQNCPDPGYLAIPSYV